jgi:DTW domain-containing protein YfiP
MHVALCLCAELAEVARIDRPALATQLVLVMHQRELIKTTATGPLALRALAHSELHVHGAPNAALDLNELYERGRRVLLLFPSEGARPLTSMLVAEDRRAITLVVPDGSWRQAGRAARRVVGLERAERVALVPGAASTYRLRQEPKAGGLATFEAIARALGVIESAALQARLEQVFLRMVEATLSTRGVSRHIQSLAPEHGECLDET